MNLRRTRPLVVLLSLLAACVLAPAAMADSIVFLKDGNVWLTSPDGAKQYQVTFDGHWDSPSQADDGTIVAAQGTNLVHMDRSGHVISTVSGLGGSTSTLLGDRFKAYGPFDPQVSPDGKHIAYWVSMYNPWSDPSNIYVSFSDAVVVTSTDHFDVQPQQSWTTSVKEPSWLTNDRTLIAGSGVGSWSFQTWMINQGNDGVQWWFTNPMALDNDPELSPDGHKLVSVAQTNGALSAQNVIEFMSVPGPAWTDPPYTNTYMNDAPHPPAGTLKCQNVRDSEAHSPSWSPDSTAIAYDDKDGLWIQQVGDLSSCDRNEKLLVPGATHPDWGPADVDMAQKPSPPGSGTPVSTGPTGTPASPGGAPAPVAITGLKVPVKARRGAGLAVRVTLSGAAPVTVTVCRLRHHRCAGRAAHRTVQARAGVTRVVVPLRRLKRGRYSVVVAVPGAAPLVKVVTLT